MKYKIYINYVKKEYEIKALKNETCFCFNCDETVANNIEFDTIEIVKSEIRQIEKGTRMLLSGFTNNKVNINDCNLVIKEVVVD